MESTGQKLHEMDTILDAIVTVMAKDSRTGIMRVKKRKGKKLRAADLVTDDSMCVNVLKYLREIRERDQMGIIIALGMAKSLTGLGANMC